MAGCHRSRRNPPHLVEVGAHDGDHCLYCRQPLTDVARSLITSALAPSPFPHRKTTRSHHRGARPLRSPSRDRRLRHSWSTSTSPTKPASPEALQGRNLKVPKFYGFNEKHRIILMARAAGTNELSEAPDDDTRRHVMSEYIDQLALPHASTSSQ